MMQSVKFLSYFVKKKHDKVKSLTSQNLELRGQYYEMANNFFEVKVIVSILYFL